MTDTHFFTRPDGRKLAYRFRDGDGPVLVFLPGYMSDMQGGKATSLFDHAVELGRAALLLDYSGCGASEGDFADGTLSRWRDDVLMSIDNVARNRPILLVGSSMGGWLMLLVALARPMQVKGLVGIAAAPDFTDWGYDEAQRATIVSDGVLYEDNPYGPEPTPTWKGFYDDANRHLLLHDKIMFDGPVRLLHGQADPDVPWQTSLKLADALTTENVQILFIKDGDHRLSRDGDIELLIKMVDALYAELG